MARKDQHGPFRELVAARLDRPLTRAESRALTAHLKDCPGCNRAESEYRAQRDQLRALAQPLPPRDMWARTSAALDLEVARGARAAWSRRMQRARRRIRSSSALLSTVAAVSVITAVTAFQLGPQLSPQPVSEEAPTPFAVDPQPLAFLGLGGTDLAIYSMTVSQVCPQTATLDCVPAHKIVRTPIGLGLPQDLQANNAALSPSGERLVLVGKQRDSDVIAVVMMPGGDGSDSNPTESVGLPESTETPEVATPTPEPTDQPTPEATPTPAATPTATATDEPGTSSTPAQPTHIGVPPTPQPDPETPTPEPTERPTPEPTATAQPTPSEPPASAAAGLMVVNVLEGVRTVGAPPAWSRNGSMLAFSAMPVDGSHGPDVYVWSPGDENARPVTSDHGSYFASWSGNRLVVSRLDQNTEGDTTPRNYVIDPGSLEARRVRGQFWMPSVNRQRTQAVVWQGELRVNDGQPELRSGALYLTAWTAVDPFRVASSDSSEPGATPGAAPNAPAVAPLVPIEVDHELRSARVADWQAGWSPDGRVLGIWIADSAGSSWGRLTVLAIDPETGLVAEGEPLMPTTLARRGFSLGSDRVAWVAPSDENVDGELRIRAWTNDGVGGLRVISPEQEEVLPAF